MRAHFLAGILCVVMSTIPAAAHAEQNPNSLPHAIAIGDKEQIHGLLEAGTDPNMGNRSTPLFMAAMSRDKESLELLLAHGADPNLPADDSKYQNRPLTAATQMGWADGVRILLAHGADPNGGNGMPPLIVAAGAPDEPGVTEDQMSAVMRMLLDAGADPTRTFEGDSNAMIYAIGSGDIEKVKTLQAARTPFQVDERNSPLERAVLSSTPEMVIYILSLQKTEKIGSLDKAFATLNYWENDARLYMERGFDTHERIEKYERIRAILKAAQPKP